MKRFLKKISVTIFILFLAGSAFGQISLKSSLDKSEITVGSRVTYSIIVDHDPGITVKMPELAVNILPPIEIRDYEVLDPVKVETGIREQVDYIITSFKTGTYPIRPVSVSYFGADSVVKTMKTDSLSLNIISTLDGGAEDIRGIKPPLEIPINYKMYLMYVGGALILVLVILFTIYYIRKRRQGKPLIPRKQAPPVPPHETAFRRLTELENSDLLIKGKIKQFYSEASEILRWYLEERFYFPALEMVTDEIMQNLESNNTQDDILSKIKAFLTEADLVKFAKHVPGTESANSVIPECRYIIEQSKIEIIAQSIAGEIATIEENTEEAQKALTEGVAEETQSGEETK